MASSHARRRLDAINFLVAAVQTGFGPFIAVFLTRKDWNQADIGFALSVGSLAAIASQLPAGFLVDRFHRKSHAAAIATLAIGASALAIGISPTWAPVLLAEIVHGFASAMLGPAIAAVTLAVQGPEELGESFGHNARYASLGSAAAALVMGLFASYASARAVLLLTAVLAIPPLLIMLRFSDADHARVDPATAHAAMLSPSERRRRAHRDWHVLVDGGLLAFAGCAAVFFIGNAAMITLAGNRLAERSGAAAGILLSLVILAPQIVVASLSPWFGRVAQDWGRRPVLLLGFIVQPVRGLLLAATGSPYVVVPAQALDGVSGAMFGVMVPLIAADLTRRTGCLNLAMGAINLAIGLGAALSTAIAGPIADSWGYGAAFLCLAGAGSIATLLVWFVMPETSPGPAVPLAAATPVPAVGIAGER